MRAIKKKKKRNGPNLGNDWNGNRAEMLQRTSDKGEGGPVHKSSVLEKQDIHHEGRDNSGGADLCWNCLLAVGALSLYFSASAGGRRD